MSKQLQRKCDFNSDLKIQNLKEKNKRAQNTDCK